MLLSPLLSPTQLIHLLTDRPRVSPTVHSMRSSKPRQYFDLLRPPTISTTTTSSARAHLPWLLPPPNRPKQPKTRTAPDHPRPLLSNAAVLRAIKTQLSFPKQILAVYSQAAKQPGFRHDYPTYKTLISTLAFHRRFRAVDLLLARMRRDGLPCGSAILLPLIDAYFAAGDPIRAVHLYLSSPPNDKIFSYLLDTLIRTNHLEIARSLLSDCGLGFPIRVRHWIGLVRAYFDRRDVRDAIELLDLMATRGSVPDVFCYGSLINGLCCGGDGAVEQAFAVVEQMRRSGREPDVVVYNTLLHGCVRKGEVERAEEMVVEMERRGVCGDVATYNTLIDGICDRRSIEDGVRVFRQMVDRGVSPDVITFSTMMDRLGKEGRVLECNALFGKMLVMGVSLDPACYRILFSVFSRNWMVGDAVMVLEVMESCGVLVDEEIGHRMMMECGGEFREGVVGLVLKRGFMGLLVEKFTIAVEDIG